MGRTSRTTSPQTTDTTVQETPAIKRKNALDLVTEGVLIRRYFFTGLAATVFQCSPPEVLLKHQTPPIQFGGVFSLARLCENGTVPPFFSIRTASGTISGTINNPPQAVEDDTDPPTSHQPAGCDRAQWSAPCQVSDTLSNLLQQRRRRLAGTEQNVKLTRTLPHLTGHVDQPET